MDDCMKRRLLYAASQAYHPSMETVRRSVGWVEPPLVISREVEYWQQPIDSALVGRTRQGVVVAFRGSLPPFFGGRHDGWTVLLDWLNDALSLVRADLEYCGTGVHWGFAESMRRLWNDTPDGAPGVRAAIQAMLDRGAPRHLFLTGHSKGGALANLAAYRAARYAGWRDMPVSVATIAACKVGNGDFAAAYAQERIACLRYELPGDPIPHFPFGPATPRWARSLARQVWPKLAKADYAPVGTRVAPAEDTARRVLLPRFDIARPGTALLLAHAICPDSGYDRLVCHGEEDCSHGRSPARALPRRHEREGTRPAERRRERAQPVAPRTPVPLREESGRG